MIMGSILQIYLKYVMIMGFNTPNIFEICYYDTRNGWEQIRTYL